MPAAAKEKPAYRDILFEVKDQVAWITINRPRVLNAFREQSLDEMIAARPEIGSWVWRVGEGDMPPLPP